MNFYEAIWHGQGIGDGADLDEALQSYLYVSPEDCDWELACSQEGANPHINRFESFDAYLDNAEALESIPVSPLMIIESINGIASDRIPGHSENNPD